MHCIWCNHETTADKYSATEKVRYANNEHIFPEAVGGRRCLPKGLVCEVCNRELGEEVDQYLKVGDVSMMHQFQIIDRIPGKNRGKEDRLRKLAQKVEIQHYSGGTTIKRSPDNAITQFINPGFYLYDEKFVRALHKCLVNCIADKHLIYAHSDALRPLKKFVAKGEGVELGWAVGLAYANVFGRHDFEPFCDSLMLDVAGNAVAGVLVFPSLLAVVGCIPETITKEFLWMTSRHLHKKFQSILSSGAAWNPNVYFMGDGFLEMSGRKSVYKKMQMILVRREIQGVPIPGRLQLLACCIYCGQINPTGMEYRKAEVLQQSNHHHGCSKNDWNAYEPEDMSLIFDAAYAQYFDRHFQSYQANGIQVDVNRLDSLRVTWSAQTICCIGCGGYTYAQPKDFFF